MISRQRTGKVIAVVTSALLLATPITSCGTTGTTRVAPTTELGTTTTPTSPSPAAPDLLPPDITSYFDGVVASTMNALSVPAVIALVSTPTGRWSTALGQRRIGAADQVSLDDRVRIGSVTKTMVGTVTLQLVAEGRLSLDTPVSQYRSDIPDGESITVAMLLNMTSGLYSYTEDSEFAAAMDEEPSRVWDPEDLLRIAVDHGPTFAPGADFRYSNTNTVLLGRLIEQITEMPLAEVIRDRVIAPAGLESTSFPNPGDASVPEPHPHGYLYGSHSSAQVSVRRPSSEIDGIRAGFIVPTDVTNLDPSWIWAAGAAISTVPDTADYVEALVAGGLVGAELQQARLDSLNTADLPFDTVDYGLGWQAFGPLIGHDGAIPGYQTFAGHDPKTRTTIVVVCTVRDGPAGGRPANTIARALTDRLGLTRS